VKFLRATRHERPKGYVCVESGLPPTSDIRRRGGHDRFVPRADSCAAAKDTLFHDIVQASEQCRSHGEAKHLGGPAKENPQEPW
jgi:hypothetical protein